MSPPNRRCCAFVLFLLFAFVTAIQQWTLAGVQTTTARLHRPIALVLSHDSKYLFAANRDSGTIAIIDTHTRKVIDHFQAGEGLANLACTPDGKYLFAIDQRKSQLIVLEHRGGRITSRCPLPVPTAPISVEVSGNGKHISITSLWSNRLTILDLERTLSTTRADDLSPKTVQLPFAPGKHLWSPNSDKIVVADAYGGQLAVVDAIRSQIERKLTIPAHNIRGLVLSRDGKSIWLSHQILRPTVSTELDNIHWGNMLTNQVRRLKAANLFDTKADLLEGSELIELGGPGAGAGDPAGLAIGPEDRLLVTLAGVNEVAVQSAPGHDWSRLAVENRPTCIVTDRAGKFAYVANTLADSVSVIDLALNKVDAVIRLGAPVELTSAQRGELLFHDARLSHDGWLSCHSCHTDGHTNELRNDNFGDGSFGAPKRVLSLLGAKDTAPFAWNGSMGSLEEQIRRSLKTTMHAKRFTEKQVVDLTAYILTLPSPPKRRLFEKQDDAQIQRGQQLFEKLRCDRCHKPPTYTSDSTYDVGIADEVGNTHFNPPSLLGVGYRQSLFHDGRATSIEDVLTRYQHQLDRQLAKQELADLSAFLRHL